jgi:hypothetical protein
LTDPYFPTLPSNDHEPACHYFMLRTML